MQSEQKIGNERNFVPFIVLIQRMRNGHSIKKERGNTMKNVCYGVAFAVMLLAVNTLVLASLMGFNSLMDVVQVI